MFIARLKSHKFKIRDLLYCYMGLLIFVIALFSHGKLAPFLGIAFVLLWQYAVVTNVKVPAGLAKITILNLAIIKTYMIATRQLFQSSSDDLLVYYSRYVHCQDVGPTCYADFLFSVEPLLYVWFSFLPGNLSPTQLLFSFALVIGMLSYLIWTTIYLRIGSALVLLFAAIEMNFFNWINGQVLRQSLAVHIILLALVVLDKKRIFARFSIIAIATSAHIAAPVAYIQLAFPKYFKYNLRAVLSFIVVTLVLVPLSYALYSRFNFLLHSISNPMSIDNAIRIAPLGLLSIFFLKKKKYTFLFFGLLTIVSVLASRVDLLYERGFLIFYIFPGTAFLFFISKTLPTFNFGWFQTEMSVLVLTTCIYIYWVFRVLSPETSGPFSPWINTIW